MKARYPIKGGCSCKAVRYTVIESPMIVHCCHCTWCQRASGAAFALNAMVEASKVRLLSGELETIHTPTNSGLGQKIVRCPKCKDAVWSNYSSANKAVHFLRVGTLDQPDTCPPDVHIFTSTKQDWVQLPKNALVFKEYYQRSNVWPQASIDRYKEALKSNS